MRILVTGGTGFIGTNLCFRLLREGHTVHCLDCNFSTEKKQLYTLMQDRGLRPLKLDVIEPFFVEVDQIFHLACPASPIHYQRDPIRTFKTAVIGTMNVLDLAKKLDVPVLIASTSEVYGCPSVFEQNESYWGNVNPIGVRSCYNEGKRAAESLAMDYYRQHYVKVRLIRIFNTYGPYLDFQDGRVVSNFILNALQNKPLIVYGDGSQTRSFQYIDDLLEGMHLMINNQQGFAGPVNLGNPEEWTILDTAKAVIQLTGSKSPIVHKPALADDPLRRKPDISLAKSRLGWEPITPFEKGLELTIEYFKNSLFANLAQALR